MDYTVKEKTQSKIVFDVKNNKDEIEKTKLEAYQKLSKDVRIPGFRKGKAPYDVGAAFIGEANLLEETLKILLDRAYVELLEKEKISPIDDPEVNVDKFENDSFEYTVAVEFLPEIAIDFDKKIELSVDNSVSEEEAKAKMQELVDSFTQIRPVEKPVEVGDIVEVGYSVDGKETKNLTLEVGKERVVGNFNEQILGKKKGDTFTVITESTSIQFTVVEVKEKIVPVVNDEFAKEAGFDSLESLNEKIKKEISENKRLQAEEMRGNTALTKIAESIDIELPRKFIEHDVDDRIKELEKNYLKRGYKLEEVLKKEGKTIEDLRKEIEKQSEKDLKEDLVLRSLILKKDIQVTDDEIKDEFNHIVETELAGKKVALTDDLKKYIRQEILRSKAVSILKENAIIKTGGE
ncbi:MAG: trigger factor [Caldisericaceae bacterium]